MIASNLDSPFWINVNLINQQVEGSMILLELTNITKEWYLDTIPIKIQVNQNCN